jgi:hypothetical protein
MSWKDFFTDSQIERLLHRANPAIKVSKEFMTSYPRWHTFRCNQVLNSHTLACSREAGHGDACMRHASDGEELLEVMPSWG